MPTVIVASDAPSVRSEVIAAIDEPGTEFIEVRDGADVRSTVEDSEPDLVICDLQMANMGAFAVCLDLRLEASYGQVPHVPVLMLLDRRPDVHLAKRSGAEGWLVKPLDPIRLQRATEALLKGDTYHDDSFHPDPPLVGGATR